MFACVLGCAVALWLFVDGKGNRCCYAAHRTCVVSMVMEQIRGKATGLLRRTTLRGHRSQSFRRRCCHTVRLTTCRHRRTSQQPSCRIFRARHRCSSYWRTDPHCKSGQCNRRRSCRCNPCHSDRAHSCRSCHTGPECPVYTGWDLPRQGKSAAQALAQVRCAIHRAVYE